MMLSQTVEYALRAVVHLAACAPAAQTTEQIAQKTQVPAAYLAKVLGGLRRAGLVRAQRGVGGGISLARSPEELTILEVVEAVEPIRRIEACPLGIAEHGSQLCPLHRRLDDALAMVQAAFGQTTLAEVLPEGPRTGGLCPFPAAGKASRPRRQGRKSHGS